MEEFLTANPSSRTSTGLMTFAIQGNKYKFGPTARTLEQLKKNSEPNVVTMMRNTLEVALGTPLDDDAIYCIYHSCADQRLNAAGVMLQIRLIASSGSYIRLRQLAIQIINAIPLEKNQQFAKSINKILGISFKNKALQYDQIILKPQTARSDRHHTIKNTKYTKPKPAEELAITSPEEVLEIIREAQVDAVLTNAPVDWSTF